MPIAQGNEIPAAILVWVDDVVALLVEAMIDLDDTYFKITNYCFVKGVPSSSYELLETLMNDKALRKP